MAPVFGKLADKRHPARSQVLTTCLMITSILVMMAMPGGLVATIVTVLLLDIGVQATQVSNVATIYTLDAAAHSRINTVYMTAYFLGGSIGTFAGVQCFHMGGWPLVTWQLLAWSAGALVLALVGWRKASRTGAIAAN